MLLLLGGVSFKYQLAKLVNSVVQGFYMATDLCLLGSVLVRRVFKSLTKNVDVCACISL